MTLQDILRDVDFLAEQLRQIDSQEAELVEQGMLVHQKLNSTTYQSTKIKVLVEDLQSIIAYFSSSASPRKTTLDLIQSFQERFPISGATTSAFPKNLFSRAVSAPEKKTKPRDHQQFLQGDWFFERTSKHKDMPESELYAQKKILLQILMKDSGYLFEDLPSPESTYIPYNTNPKYGQVGYNDNCARVVNAHELRRRGYDVTANEMDLSDRSQYLPECIGGWVNPATGKSAWDDSVSLPTTVEEGRKVSATKELISRKFGVEGARGTVSMILKPNTKGSVTGHIFNWEVQGDKVIWVDAQSNRIGDEMNSTFYGATTIRVARFDDKEPTLLVLQYLASGWK